MGDLHIARRRKSGGSLRAVAGFTLLELMVTVVAAAIIAAFAVPSFQSTINNSRLASASNELLVSMQTARIEAMRYNRRTVVCLSTNPTAGTPGCAGANATNATGFIAFVDNDRNAAFGAGDLLLRRSTLPANVKVIGSSNLQSGVAVTFRSDGFARNATNQTYRAAIDLCMPVKRPSENIRRLFLGAGGRIVIERASTAANLQCVAPGNPTS
ncbi:Type IV fimbrial biogenesis protein FimT [Lysobacter dokdonensis DS-58]|uniref:Type II secretion system protein H n=1 Tax=Lysobacter dokdonensis DS-58 TaxID=1300345 RepID=A0A0A2WQB1_9GAMM|nr:GspH/FimT family pseudopilin [Lysobacter dokdonensis]KGQ20485.1 Type IV fimbrial biogenesis protein FimT [Lysobacter dokdonensis DS-58]